MKKIYFQVLILSITIASCNNGKLSKEEIEAELAHVDTLDFQLNNIKGLLDKVNYQDIQERTEIIANNYAFCSDKLKEKNIKDEEKMYLLEEYKALGYIYKNALENYKGIVQRTEELFAQSKTLRSSVQSKDYEKETFKRYYFNQKAEILELNKTCAKVLKPVVDTEFTFERRQTAVEELAEELNK